MKNFKLFALVLCLVMLVSSAAMADMTPGTYTGVATGMFDGLTVEVTVSATAIEDIKVTSHNETAPGWPALEKLPPLAGVTGSAVLFALLNQLPQGWLGFEGTHLAALPAAWYKPNLFWLGLPDLTVFSSSDYFPLLPWVFLYWVGYFFARWFRARCTAQPGLPPKALRPLCAVGSRTLLIYMLHQPVIYGALLGLHALGLA